MADAAKDSARFSGFRLSPELIAIVTMGLMLGAGMFNLSGRIDSLRIEMRTEIQALRTEMDEKFAELRAEMNQKFAELRTEMNGKFAQAREETNEQFGQQREETNRRFGEMNGQFDQVRAEIRDLRTEMNEKFAQAREETNGQFDQLRAEIRGLRTAVREDRLALSSADQALRKETSDRFLSVEGRLQILQSALIRPPDTPSSEQVTEPENHPAPGAE